MDKNPLMKEQYNKEFREYEKGQYSQENDNFKSKRPGTTGDAKDDFSSSDFNYERSRQEADNAEEWSQTKYLRRYRYAHLRNKTNVPMSIRNEDRHGIANLQHERVKPLDKYHTPPWFLIVLVVIPLGYWIYDNTKDDENSIENL